MSVDMLTANAGLGPILDDGLNLFDSDHGNLAGSSTTIDVANVADGRQAMRAQTGLGGVFPVQIAPVAILVSPARELLA